MAQTIKSIDNQINLLKVELRKTLTIEKRTEIKKQIKSLEEKKIKIKKRIY